MPSPASDTLSRMMERVSSEDQKAISELVPIVYGELRKLAGGYMRNERRNTLQTTALVHEAYLRLLRSKNLKYANRAHFLAIAARAMRQILVERSRARMAAKRGGGQIAITLDDAMTGGGEDSADLLALDDALNKLSKLDPQQSEIVELRYFGGLTVEETATVMSVSPATVKRRWELSKAWLRREMST